MMALPIDSHAARITEHVEKHRVTVIHGETGCGKSTQVPQYILEEMCSSGRGAEANIVVTQLSKSADPAEPMERRRIESKEPWSSSPGTPPQSAKSAA